MSPASNIRRCPKCRGIPIRYTELWTNHVIEFDANPDGTAEPEGGRAMIYHKPIESAEDFIRLQTRWESLEHAYYDLVGWEIQEQMEIDEELERCPFEFDDDGNVVRKAGRDEE